MEDAIAEELPLVVGGSAEVKRELHRARGFPVGPSVPAVLRCLPNQQFDRPMMWASEDLLRASAIHVTLGEWLRTELQRAADDGIGAVLWQER
ncbi:hypothetical protein CGZ92_03925 [Parenemella sanctibonifatiensis]|uniref:Uncharacterized protein n=1 Tax=Parenemella sanctibonifatiensis TaxID=2016505 RepID=A0A255EBB0_9ACTN|nr:hypothetical protein CGZ92_03925 [Parenemella sanctibonifatiensis]